MATTATLNDLARSVMENLQLLAPGESPNARDRALIIERYRYALEEMRDERVTYWEDDAIPHEVFMAIVEYMALAVQKAFGYPAPTGEDMTRALTGAKTRIRARIVKPNTQMPTRTSYF